MSIAVQQVKAELAEAEKEKVASRVEERLLDLLLPQAKGEDKSDVVPAGTSFTDSQKATRERFREMLRDGKFDDREIEVNVQSKKRVGIEVMGQPNMEELQDAMQSLGSIFGNGRAHNRKLTIKRAREILPRKRQRKLLIMTVPLMKQRNGSRRWALYSLMRSTRLPRAAVAPPV